MVWLIAIMCIIVVVVFWRVFPPLALMAAYGLLVLFIYTQSNYARNERRTAEQTPQQTVATANATTGALARVWQVSSEPDPASGAKMPRTASVLSDDGLCQLLVEQGIRGHQTVGIYCPTLKLSPRRDIEVKIDNRPTSDTMSVERFSDGSDLYISPYQNSRQLPYDEFLRRMTTADKMAFLLHVENGGKRWLTFSLNGSAAALTTIGALSSKPGVTQIAR